MPRSLQEQLLQSCCVVSPGVQSVGQAILVQAQLPLSSQVQVLQPSSAGFCSPAMHALGSSGVSLSEKPQPKAKIMAMATEPFAARSSQTPGPLRWVLRRGVFFIGLDQESKRVDALEMSRVKV